MPGLKCYQRDASSDVPPGCVAGGAGDLGTHDYCYDPCSNNQAPTLANLGGSMENMAAGQTKLCACEGDCDKDSDCMPGLKCYQRDASSDVPPGCVAGGAGDLGTHDYCYNPAAPAVAPAVAPAAPAAAVGPCSNNQAPTLANLGGSMENMPSGQTKLCACEGDCDKDSDCAPGLKCYQRDS